jgi:hypothetical protein
MLKKTFILSLLSAFIVILSCGLAQATTVTIATFADPAVNWSTPLFKIDLVNDIITGGWADANTGLSLKIPYFGNTTYPNAFFTMTDVNYTGSIGGGSTGGGTVKFFANGQDINTTPLIQIVFNSGHVTPLNFGAMDLFYSDGVVITGSVITGTLTNESFAFSFANHTPLDGDLDNGYTATASFTSSATTPEPATIALFSLGGLALLRRRGRKIILLTNKGVH